VGTLIIYVTFLLRFLFISSNTIIEVKNQLTEFVNKLQHFSSMSALCKLKGKRLLLYLPFFINLAKCLFVNTCFFSRRFEVHLVA